ncbi:MAG: transcription antitermination factor NusB [bacterium]|nr:transcription antitermination factor NusB [bacterium]
MLNRRILRVKAMQSLYAMNLVREADMEVTKIRLSAEYDPDLNANELPDMDALKASRETALKLFNEHYEEGSAPKSDDIDEEIVNTVNKHIQEFHNMVSKDELTTKKNMVNELDKIYFHYLKLLMLPEEFALLDQRDFEKRQSSLSGAASKSVKGFNFHQNPYVKAFKNFKSFELERIRKNITWDNHRDQLHSWFKEIKKDDKEFQDYQALAEPTNEDHLNILNHIVKGLPFKMENMTLFMEEEDIHWTENKSIIKSLINKTIKSYDENLEEKYSLMDLNKNEEEDIPFFKELYTETISKDKEYEDIIARKAKNWEVGRMATMDRIILKMALAEMINFPSIPVKVTINEYIELSKKYSTPKSKQFVNGILDVMANELTSEGVIKKSGRGLIDNQ